MVVFMYEVNIYEQVAKNIKKYRKIAGITQAELAEAIGVLMSLFEELNRKKKRKRFLFKRYGIFLKR